MVSEVPSNYYTPILSSYDYSNSSHQVNLDKEYLNDTKEKEIWTRSYHKLQLHNTHSFKRRKNCNHSDNSISYRTYRMRALLVKHFEYALHHLSWMWKYNNTKTPFDTLQRRTAMSASCRYCGNPIVFDSNILSKNGKHKPLNEWNHEPHDCKFSPFNKAREPALEKKAIKKLEEYEIIEDLRDKVTATNNKLWNYELELVVRYKEF